jgi:hypothetical protein
MSTHLLMSRVVLMVVLGFSVLTGWISSAEAVLTIRSAAVVNGVAVVEGGNAPRAAPISWEGTRVTQANNGGNFSFQGVVPADCVGRLEDGVPADAVDVALANCAPVSSAPAPVPQTGQTTSYAMGDDGDIEAGVPWPAPRFTDHGNGTVRDNLTGLIWLKDGNCALLYQPSWWLTLAAANRLASGSCGLSDGSVAGDWRLSNVKELHSLLDYGQAFPALPVEHPFIRVARENIYWTSTGRVDQPPWVWVITMDGGVNNANAGGIGFPLSGWPVRGGD